MREWVFQTLLNSPFYMAVGGRIHEASASRQVPDKKPYSYYRIGVSTGRVHTSAPIRVTPFEVFVLDLPGTYSAIDAALELAIAALTSIPLTYYVPQVTQCLWIETSGDVPEDQFSGTISKFARFSLVHT